MRSWLCFATLAVVLALVSARRCDPDTDMKGYYLSCKDGEREMIWYWDDRECDASGMPTRDRVSGLPCDDAIDCVAGEYLPWAASSCQNCPAGTFSIGGGARFDHFDEWPQERSVIFRTWCQRPNNYVPQEGDKDANECDGWRASGAYLDSGDMSGYNSISSILVVSFVLTESNSVVKFEYSLDTEKGSDGLWLQLGTDAPMELEPTAEFKEIKFNLDAGLHFLTFTYYKDEAGSQGLDMARIDFIEIFGLRHSDNECTPCPPGFASDEIGAEACMECDFNTIAPEEGSLECVACPEDEYALQGTFECMPRTEVCDADDYEFLFTPCHQDDQGRWVREKAANWEQPDICLHDGSVQLPASETGKPCAECPAGYHTLSAAGECELCPVGHAASGEEFCEACPAGTAAIPEISFVEWDEWAPGFSTGCIGDSCTTSGWELHSDHIHTGHNQGQRVDVWLKLVVDIEFLGGSIEFEYQLDGGNRYSYMQFLIDGYYGQLFKKEVDGPVQSVRFDLEEGHHELVWNFHRLDNANQDPTARATLNKILLRGTVRGGAGECVGCEPGTYQAQAEQQECLPCAPGSIASEAMATKCDSCTGHTFARFEGSTECRSCGTGTEPNEDHSDCVSSCTFKDKENIYDLTPLSNVHDVGGLRNDSVFYFSFCDRLSAKTCGSSLPYVCEDRRFTTVGGEVLNFRYDSGSFLEFVPAPTMSEYNFELVYTDGSYEDCPLGSNRKTTIRFKCNGESSSSTIAAVTPASDRCNNVFEVVSPYACRVCTINDFDRSEGSCSGGSRTVSFTKKPDAVCAYDRQDDIQETCADVELSWAPVIIFAVALFALLTAIILVLLYVYRKKRQLEHKYSMLVSNSGEGGATEMAAM